MQLLFTKKLPAAAPLVKRQSERPAGRSDCKIKNIFPLKMPERKRRQFQSCSLQLLGLKAVAGEHLHAGKACGLDGGSGLVKAVGQAGNVV